MSVGWKWDDSTKTFVRNYDYNEEWVTIPMMEYEELCRCRSKLNALKKELGEK